MKEIEDMGGAAAVVAAAWGAGQLNIKRKVSFISPLLKMVGKDAQTERCSCCEQWNQHRNYQYDAEGRLIWRMLVYACKEGEESG